MGDKISTFCSSTVGVGKIAEVEGEPPELGDFFFQRITHFKHILIQIFAENIILNYCSVLVRN